MIRTLFFIALLSFFFPALASGPNILTDEPSDFMYDKSGRTQLMAEVEESQGYFCLLSDSGGGDSGGGVWPQSVNPKSIPSPRDLLDRDGYEDFLQDQVKDFGDEPVEVSMAGTLDQLHETAPQNLTFDVVDLLNCDHGRGIPVSAVPELLHLLKMLRVEAEYYKSAYDIDLIDDLIAILNAPEEI